MITQQVTRRAPKQVSDEYRALPEDHPRRNPLADTCLVVQLASIGDLFEERPEGL
jgi:hypothetical protein